MKNTQKEFVKILVIILIVFFVIGTGVYFVDQIDTTKAVLSDAVFLEAVGENAIGVRARGDINGDGYEDAIVEEVYCVASCSVGLEVVFNEKNSTARLFKSEYPAFEPSYRGSSAIKSDVTSITIKNGVISFTGTALECPDAICDEVHQNIVRTVTYKFNGTNIVQLSVNPPLE